MYKLRNFNGKKPPPSGLNAKKYKDKSFVFEQTEHLHSGVANDENKKKEFIGDQIGNPLSLTLQTIKEQKENGKAPNKNFTLKNTEQITNGGF